MCGYLLQAWTSEKASGRAGALQREHDQETRDQQVQQDRMQAQVRRTERWVDACCVPVGRALGEYMNSRYRFGECHNTTLSTVSCLCKVLRVLTPYSSDGRVWRRAVAACAAKLEAAQPAAFAELYKDYSMKYLKDAVKDDGSIPDLFDPNTDFKGRTWGVATLHLSYLTGTSLAVLDVYMQEQDVAQPAAAAEKGSEGMATDQLGSLVRTCARSSYVPALCCASLMCVLSAVSSGYVRAV